MKFYPILCIISMMVCYSTQMPSHIWGHIRTVGCTNVTPHISCPYNILDCDSYCELVAMYHDRIEKNNVQCAYSDPPKECPSKSPTYCVEYCHPIVYTEAEPTVCLKPDLHISCPKDVDCKFWCDYAEVYDALHKNGNNQCAVQGEPKYCPYDNFAPCVVFCHPTLFKKV